MVLDRALTPDLLDVAMLVAIDHGSSPDARRLLTIALRDHTSAQEAEGKTKKCLSRIWVAPPAPAEKMVRWALDHLDADPDRRILHLGAMLATFPFAGTVCGVVGRQLHVEGAVDPMAVRTQVCAILGDRSTIDVGARKVVTTLRYLGLLVPDGRRLQASPNRPEASRELIGWLSHALLLTRQIESLAVDEATRAPELAVIRVPGSPQGDEYSLLETFSEGSGGVLAPSRR